MFITGFLMAFLLAIILTLLLAVGFRGQAWGAGLAFFFLILFLATWAGGLWLTPVGPLMMGVPWMSFLLVALIVGLILAATTPSRYRRGEEPGRGETVAPDRHRRGYLFLAPDRHRGALSRGRLRPSKPWKGRQPSLRPRCRIGNPLF